MSWKPEVRVIGDDKWYGNAICLATEEEAAGYARDLFTRWMQAKATRVVKSDDPVNYRWADGKLTAVEAVQ